jgi:hypothetical protein
VEDHFEKIIKKDAILFFDPKRCGDMAKPLWEKAF